MTILAATPYLILFGKAAQAIPFYQQALGAKLESSMRFGDMDASCPAARRDLIMHAVMQVGKTTFMLSDGGGGGQLTEGTGTGAHVEVALSFDDADQTRSVFAALAEGGRVVEPIMNAPWGALFGALVDRFGVSWMFNCDMKPQNPAT